MRSQLKKLMGKRLIFFAEFIRYGFRLTPQGWERTVLLHTVRDGKGRILTSHAWVRYVTSFRCVGELQKWDVIRFEATIDQYEKNHFDELEQLTDYRFRNIESVKVLARFQQEAIDESLRTSKVS